MNIYINDCQVLDVVHFFGRTLDVTLEGTCCISANVCMPENIRRGCKHVSVVSRCYLVMQSQEKGLSGRIISYGVGNLFSISGKFNSFLRWLQSLVACSLFAQYSDSEEGLLPPVAGYERSKIPFFTRGVVSGEPLKNKFCSLQGIPV